MRCQWAAGPPAVRWPPLVPRGTPNTFGQHSCAATAGPDAGAAAQVGADLCMGSLIKSPGGTIVPAGGYIAGRASLVAAAAARLTAPGVGKDAGAVSGETLRLMFQGAPPRRCQPRIRVQSLGVREKPPVLTT